VPFRVSTCRSRKRENGEGVVDRQFSYLQFGHVPDTIIPLLRTDLSLGYRRLAKPLTVEDFSPHLRRTFSLAGRSEVLTLVSVETGRGSPTLVRTPFMLIFRGKRDKILPEGQYRLVAEGGPGFDLYVIPIVTGPGDHQDYQVVFN
jgi:hypothetical protein